MSPVKFVASRLTPFRVREYRKLYLAQTLSWVGTWMQDMGKSWLVLSQFGKGTEMGILFLASALPVALFSIKAGIYADRSNPRKILLISQFALFAAAFFLATAVYTGVLHFWHLVVIAFVEGMAIAYDAPAFQVLLPRLVGKENLQQTLALNSSSFHASRIVGPALGGIILASAGVSSIFLFNALSFLFVFYTLLSFKNLPLSSPTEPSKANFKEFISFLWKHPFFARILVQFLLVMLFIFPHTFTTLRLLVTQRFQLNGKGFGILLTGPGLGAFIGSALLVVLKPAKPYQLFPFGLSGIVIFGSLILYCNNFWTMNVLLTVYTLSLFLYLSSLLISLQIMTDHSLRGRLGALITLAFGAWAPAWSAVWGGLSDVFGAPHVFGVTLISFLFFSLLVVFSWDKFFGKTPLEQAAK